MSKIFEKDRKFIILNSNEELSEEKFEQFNNLVKKRSKGEPIAYLLNKKDFWKYEFYVDKGILIPRPDSEIIIEQILRITDHKKKSKSFRYRSWIWLFIIIGPQRKKKFSWSWN
jgi:release factor glutamine methyltransferase